ncbi:hypothetical protein [Photobacterium kishitanii]|uniref:hypothetical protein n=1 Tax=Photobacterium kishitanii TaxID=318456 RepID=UPI000D158207|nr:hypothetical protein [Photobacterium kishitanii]PSU20128.1 hypothetical protein CTM84_14190 [Photobacterium kishitanii]PSV12241.1 hypothetical protein C0W59_18765 [Photobacterium kishitanii]
MTTEITRLICGAGIIDTDIELKENGRYINQYRTWRAMIRQAYGANIKNRRVEGLTVCDDWFYFSKYKAWFDANKKERFYVSRDLKIPGNKHYSPETCVFVPYAWGRLFPNGRKELIDKEMQRCRVEYADDKEFMRLVDSILDRYQ